VPGKPPYFPFFPADFASDGVVESMPTEGVGAYILLLCKAWSQSPAGTIPDDDDVLARWARLTPQRWAELRPAVLAAFVRGKDGRFHQKRMKAEYAKLMKLLQSRSHGGRKTAAKRWSDSAGSSPTDQPLLSDSSAIARASESNSKSNSDSHSESSKAAETLSKGKRPRGGGGAGVGRRRFVPPSVEEVRAYVADQQSTVDPQRFVDHYTAKGWLIGKTPMKDWQAALRTWESNDNGNTTGKGKAHAGFAEKRFRG